MERRILYSLDKEYVDIFGSLDGISLDLVGTLDKFGPEQEIVALVQTVTLTALVQTGTLTALVQTEVS